MHPSYVIVNSQDLTPISPLTEAALTLDIMHV
jgi:hypothetical protein